MAQPYLSFTELQQQVPDRTGEYYGAAIRSAGETAGNLISSYKQAKENDAKGIFDPRNDVNQITNSAFRLAGIKNYDKFKEKWLPIYQNQRARFSPEQELERQNDVQNLQKEIEYYNMHAKYIDAARKKADGVYTSFDQESMDKVIEAVGSDDSEVLNEALSNAMKTNSGTPFLKINPIDADNEFNAIFNKLGKDTRVAEVQRSTRDVNGRSVTSEKQMSVPKLDPEQQRATAYAMVNTWKPEKRMAVENDLTNKMSPEEQSEADALFPDSATPLTLYNLEKRGIESDTFVKKSITAKPTSKSGQMDVINQTERGWSFGSNPVLISRELEYSDDGGSKKKVFSNAKIGTVKINEDGDYVATAVVPVDQKEIRSKIEAEENAIQDKRPEGFDKWSKRKKKPYLAKENEEMDAVADKYATSDKYKTIEIPLENVYDEIKDKMEDRGIVLEGFSDIDFNKKESKADRVPEFKTKNTTGASGDDLSAIEWVRENPTNPKSKKIYNYLIEKGYIE